MQHFSLGSNAIEIAGVFGVHLSLTSEGVLHSESEIREDVVRAKAKEDDRVSSTVESPSSPCSWHGSPEEPAPVDEGQACCSESRACFEESSAFEERRTSLVKHLREKFGEDGRVQVQVLGRFGSFHHAQVKINGDRISLQGEDITSFVEFPKHAIGNELLSSSWSTDLRYFVVSVDGYMTMVELVPVELAPEAKDASQRLKKELNIICRSSVIVALQIAKRRGDFEDDPSILIELIHRTRQFARPFVKALNPASFLALQKALGVPYFENPAVSDKGAEVIVEEYFDAVFTPCRTAQFWNQTGLIEAIAFMDFQCALKCFEAGIRVAQDDATEAMLCANWGQVSGEAIVANYGLLESCPRKTLMQLNRATKLDPRLIDTEYGCPLLLKPWLLYIDNTLDDLRRQRHASMDST